MAASLQSTASMTHPVIRILLSPRFMPSAFALFVLLRLLVLAVPVEPYSDFQWYFVRGVEIAASWTYQEDGWPTAFWPVGYPGFLGVLFSVTGPSVFAAQLANVAFASATFWLVYGLSRRLFDDEAAARLSCLLLAIYPNNVAYSALVATEPLYTALLVGICLGFVVRPQGWHIAVLGLAIGYATLVKTQTALLAVILVLLSVWWERNWLDRRGAVLRGCVVGLLALAVVLPWTYRNYVVFGQPVFVSTNGGISMLSGNNPSMVGLWHQDFAMGDPLMSEARFSVADQVNGDRRARDLVREWIRENPGTFLALMPQKFWRFWAPDGEAEWSFQETTPWYAEQKVWFRAVRGANQAYYAIVLLLAAACLLAMVQARVRREAYIGFAVAAFFTGLSLAFSGQSRYHYPLMPFMIIYAAWFVTSLLTKRSERSGAT